MRRAALLLRVPVPACRVPPLLSVSLPCLSPPPPPHRGRCRPPPLHPAVQSAALPRLRSPRIRLVRVRVRVPLLHSARCDRAHARNVLAAAGRAATELFVNSLLQFLHFSLGEVAVVQDHGDRAESHRKPSRLGGAADAGADGPGWLRKVFVAELGSIQPFL